MTAKQRLLLLFALFLTGFAMADQIQEFELSIGQALSPTDQVSLQLRVITHEAIEPAQGYQDSYPAGNGIVVILDVSCNGESELIELSLLSSPYESRDSQAFCALQIKLIQASESRATISLSR
jgi:hypothetical protein